MTKDNDVSKVKLEKVCFWFECLYAHVIIS